MAISHYDASIYESYLLSRWKKSKGRGSVGHLDGTPLPCRRFEKIWDPNIKSDAARTSHAYSQVTTRPAPISPMGLHTTEIPQQPAQS